MKIDAPFKLICDVPKNLQVVNLEHWNENTSRQQEYQQHKDTQTIFLRFRKELDKIVNFELVDYPLMQFYRNEIDQYLKVLSQYYNIENYSVIIANLKGGGIIPLHYDCGEYFETSHRIHIPIKTTENVFFLIGNVELNMKSGFAYEIDNVGSMHGVLNLEEQDRHHIIFDLFENRLITKNIFNYS